MRLIIPAAAAALLLVCLACSGGTGSGSGVDVDVRLDPLLEGNIEVVSAHGARPGTANPIDVEVVLRNPGSVPRRVELRGSWNDAGGRFQGGTSDVRVLQPGQQDTFSTGTRSTRAVAFHLAVNPTEATRDEMLTATLAHDARNAPGHGITYTEKPNVNEIPAWTPRGVANDAPFTAETLFFRPDGDGWRFEISDRAFDPLLGTARLRELYEDVQTVYLDLPREPAPSTVFEREMAYGGGFFQIKTSPTSRSTTSWNTSLAWAIEISEWDRQPWEEGGRTFQPGGTASGRLYVAFKGSQGGFRNSWLSGTFEKVPIVYYGRPPER